MFSFPAAQMPETILWGVRDLLHDGAFGDFPLFRVEFYFVAHR